MTTITLWAYVRARWRYGLSRPILHHSVIIQTSTSLALRPTVALLVMQWASRVLSVHHRSWRRQITACRCTTNGRICIYFSLQFRTLSPPQKLSQNRLHSRTTFVVIFANNSMANNSNNKSVHVHSHSRIPAEIRREKRESRFPFPNAHLYRPVLKF